MGEIVELGAEKGKKFDENGETVGFHGRSIVFLPKGADPETTVRVELTELPKKDVRGRAMYRGEPAPDKIAERWRDNGDATASRIQHAIDWKGVSRELGAVEIRRLATRESSPSSQPERRILWGITKDSTLIEEREVRVYTLFAEKVTPGGEIREASTGTRNEYGGTRELPLVKWHVRSYGGGMPFNAQWDDSASVIVRAHFGESPQAFVEDTLTLAALPAWARQELESLYPICSCGRKRRDTQEKDGYPKCADCRREEACHYCGKVMVWGAAQGHVYPRHSDGRMVCMSCWPYEEQYRLITGLLTDEHRLAIGDEAARLLSGETFSQEAGETILRATADHISNRYDHADLMTKCKGYSWYYFYENGIYGSKFSRAALELLRFLPQAAGSALVEFVAWIAGGARPQERDYYALFEKGGEQKSVPQITEQSVRTITDKIPAGKPVLADWLRGSEKDRQAALVAYHLLKEYISVVGRHGFEQMEAELNKLIFQVQDYSSAMEKLAHAGIRTEHLVALRALLRKEYSSCPACGVEWIVSSGKASCYCLEDEVAMEEPPFVIKRSATADDRAIVVVECVGPRHVVQLSVHDLPELEEVKTETLWHMPTEEERSSWFRVRELEQQLVALDYETERCRGEYASRVLLTFEWDAERGTLFSFADVHELQVRELKTGEENQFTGKVKFVCAPGRCDWLDTPPAAGETWVCSWGKMIGRDKKGRPIVVANPQVRVDMEAHKAIEVEIEKIKTEINRGRAGASQYKNFGDPQENVSPETLEALKEKFKGGGSLQ